MDPSYASEDTSHILPSLDHDDGAPMRSDRAGRSRPPITMSTYLSSGYQVLAKATSIAVLGENDVLRQCTQRRLSSLLDEPRRTVVSHDRKRKTPTNRICLRIQSYPINVRAPGKQTHILRHEEARNV